MSPGVNEYSADRSSSRETKMLHSVYTLVGELSDHPRHLQSAPRVQIMPPEVIVERTAEYVSVE